MFVSQEYFTLPPSTNHIGESVYDKKLFTRPVCLSVRNTLHYPPQLTILENLFMIKSCLPDQCCQIPIALAAFIKKLMNFDEVKQYNRKRLKFSVQLVVGVLIRVGLVPEGMKVSIL